MRGAWIFSSWWIEEERGKEGELRVCFLGNFGLGLRSVLFRFLPARFQEFLFQGIRNVY